jgi:hypothetical protein
VFQILAKIIQRGGVNYDETKFSCDYLRLHGFSGKIISKTPCHAMETGILSFLKTIFNGATDADEAIKFINNHNLTMLVTRRTYTNPMGFTDDVVALLSLTDRNKPVVYIGWAAVSGGQLTADKVTLPSPLADSQSVEYGFPDGPGLPKQLPNRFTRLGLMTVMLDLMEGATCRYKKIKSSYIYLNVNPNESKTNTSPHPFWTKRGFDPGNETLVMTPLTATEVGNPVLRNQHALKTLTLPTTAQAEVLVGVKELRAHFIIHPQDGKQTEDDEGMVIYSRRHTKECTVVHVLTDEARDAILAEAARKAQEEQAGEDTPQEGEDTPPEDDAETKRKAAKT